MHLADHHTFGPVIYKATGIRHERHITQGDVLVGGFFHFPVFLFYIQAQKRFKRDGISAVAHGGFGRRGVARGSKFILQKFKSHAPVGGFNREYVFKCGLKASEFPFRRGNIGLQKVRKGTFLHIQ